MNDNMERLKLAIALATIAHHGQFRDSGEPYICHPMRVMQRVLDGYQVINDIKPVDMNREDVACAAVLHDIIEDTPLTYSYISDIFGPNVADIVNILTRDKENETYQEFIKIVSESRIASFIKLADLNDNMSYADELPEEKKSIVQRYEKAVDKLVPIVYDYK